MGERPRISPSSINMYLRCGEQYRRTYIEGERRPPGIAAHIGTGVHEGARANFGQKVETHVDLKPSEIVEIAVAAMEYRAITEGVAVEQGKAPEVEMGEAKDTTAALAAHHATIVAPQYQPVIVEERVKLELPKATHDLVGVIDVADDKHRIVDFKTTGRKKQQAEADQSLQLTTYAVLYRHLTGTLPESLALDVTYRKQEIDREVFTTHRDQKDIAVLVQTINVVLAGINAGVFPPATPGSWWCSAKWCGFYATCRYQNPK